MYHISQLARKFSLSRSTLLYYDRIGLLSPSGRTEAGYRLYSSADHARLEKICSFRQAGVAIDDIRRLLASEADTTSLILQRRLAELGEELRVLHRKQRLLAGMLKAKTEGFVPPTVDKALWIEMLRAAGMDDEGMCRWHEEFERRAPQSHHDFLLGIGIPEEEVLHIRKLSAEGRKKK